MPVVAVGKHLGGGVRNPGLVYIGVDLVLCRYLAEPAGLRQIFTGVFVSLITIEDADGDGDVEAITALRAAVVVLPFQGGVGGSVGVCKFHIGIRHPYGGLGCPIIRPFRQRLLLQIRQVARQRRRNKIAGNIERAARLLVADQRLQLIAGLHQVHLSARLIRFELCQLQIQALVIQLANVARIVTVVVNLQLVPKAAQVVLCQL